MSVPGSAPFSSIVGRNGQSMDQGAMSEQQMVKYVCFDRHHTPKLQVTSAATALQTAIYSSDSH